MMPGFLATFGWTLESLHNFTAILWHHPDFKWSFLYHTIGEMHPLT